MKNVAPDSLAYAKRRYEALESKALDAKYRLAVAVEAAVMQNLESDQIGLTDEQVNALLDWKQEFEEFEAARIAQRQVQIESDIADRQAELDRRKGTTNAARRRKAKNAR